MIELCSIESGSHCVNYKGSSQTCLLHCPPFLLQERYAIWVFRHCTTYFIIIYVLSLRLLHVLVVTQLDLPIFYVGYSYLLHECLGNQLALSKYNKPKHMHYFEKCCHEKYFFKDLVALDDQLSFSMILIMADTSKHVTVAEKVHIG